MTHRAPEDPGTPSVEQFENFAVLTKALRPLLKRMFEAPGGPVYEFKDVGEGYHFAARASHPDSANPDVYPTLVLLGAINNDLTHDGWTVGIVTHARGCSVTLQHRDDTGALQAKLGPFDDFHPAVAMAQAWLAANEGLAS